MFSEGRCPTQFKIAIIKPIFENGNRTDPKNYRLNSIISILSKIFEKALKERLVSFLNNNRMLSQFQFVFKTGKSTSDAIAQLMKKIYTSLDNSRPCAGIFIDLTKA